MNKMNKLQNITKYLVFNDQKKLIFLSASFLFISSIINIYGVAKIGFSEELDRYYLQYAITSFCIASIIWPLANILIPLLVKNKIEIKSANYIYYVAGIISLVLYLTITIILDYFISSIKINLRDLMIFGLLLYLDIIYNLIQSQYQKHNKYIKLNLNSLLSVGFQLLTVILLVEHLHVYALIFGLIISKIAFIILSLRHSTLKYKIDNISLRINLQKSIRIVLSSFYSRTGEITDRYLSSLLQVGAISTIAFSARISSAISSVMNNAIVNPTITRFGNCSNYDCCKIILMAKCRLILLMASVITAMWWTFGYHFIDLIMSPTSNDIDVQTVFYTSMVLLFGAILNPLSGLLNNLLLTYEEIEKVYQSDIRSFITSIILKFYLTIMYGYTGLIISLGAEPALKLMIKYYYYRKLTIEVESS